jgi:hypothetical protein
MGLILFILLAFILIVRLSKIIKMLKDPQVWKGIGFHFLFLLILNVFAAIAEGIAEIVDTDGVDTFSADVIYLIFGLWLISSFLNKPMKKAGMLVLSIIFLGFLFNRPDQDFPIDSSESSTTFVDPHFVNGYEREDGTYVDGYWRDGDGDTSINRTIEKGGGYWRSNPDGNPHNNLKS